MKSDPQITQITQMDSDKDLKFRTLDFYQYQDGKG